MTNPNLFSIKNNLKKDMALEVSWNKQCEPSVKI